MLPSTAPGSPQVQFPQARKCISRFGYSCQAYLALEVAKGAFSVAVPWVWFSTRFNSVDNVDSSNPAQIYLDLSRAVQTGDAGSKTIRGYRSSSLNTVVINVSDPSKSKTLQDRINTASTNYFRPQVWLLDLEAIAHRKGIGIDELLEQCRRHAEEQIKKNPGQILQPDEYLIKDLREDEYATIIDG